MPISSNTSLMVPNHPVLPPQTPLLLEWHKPTTTDGSILIAYLPHSHAFPDSDVKWPTGLSFFNALTKLLFDSEGFGDKPEHQSQEQSNSENQANTSVLLSLDIHHRNMSLLE
ncbi:hypothetical protein Bca52824_057262 [Brassica carinata]|uniref:Uncharacterized protein n=1 Tax=Brassica carinata TaxID=52824 RepID=A0A8X7QRU9_BRACI|nr:hypothetical protein Bca52824_057262 [Brassica carinata]